MKTQTNSKSNTIDNAVRLATKVVNAKDGGACAAVRAVTIAFPSFKRSDVMEVSARVGINNFTTSRQFHLTRHNKH